MGSVKPLDNDLVDIAALTPTDGNIMVGDGTDWVTENGATARTSLGAQAQGDVLDDLNTLGASTADGEFLVATGAGTLAWESGATALTSIGGAAASHTHAASDITSGTLTHERGGIEADISAVAIGDVIAGTGTGTMGLVTASGASDGDVLTIQADGTAAWEAAAGGGISWNDTASGTSGDGLTLTIDNSASASTTALQLTVGNTQSNQGLRVLDMEMGNASLTNCYGIYLNASGGTTTKAIYVRSGGHNFTGAGYLYSSKNGTERAVDATEGTGILIDLGTGDSAVGAHFQSGNSNIMYLWSANYSGGRGLLYASTVDSPFNGNAWRQIYMKHARTGSSDAARSTNVSEIDWSHSWGAITRSNDYDLFHIKRTTITANASANITEAGAVLHVENVATQTSGTLTDSVNILELVQDADSTGYPISVTQNAVTSTNFKKIADFAGTVIWVSDGTTPNGNLSGTAGDICLNGASSQAFYCTGTTNWTGM